MPWLAFGNFLGIVLNFLILAFVIFLIVRKFNAGVARHLWPAAAVPPATPEDILLLREIRDLLRR